MNNDYFKQFFLLNSFILQVERSVCCELIGVSLQSSYSLVATLT